MKIWQVMHHTIIAWSHGCIRIGDIHYVTILVDIVFTIEQGFLGLVEFSQFSFNKMKKTSSRPHRYESTDMKWEIEHPQCA